MKRGLVLFACLVVPAIASDAVAQSSPGGAPTTPQIIPGQFIVELQPGVAQDTVLRAHGVSALARWRLVNGFVARMSDVAADRLARDARVKSVRPDLVVEAFPKKDSSGRGGSGGGSGAPATCPDTSGAMTTPQQLPTGVSRIGPAGKSTGSEVKVAVIDTGVDDCHPDLRDNVKGGINIIDSTKAPRDDNGHGTHVAGTIAASDNGFGVVGVAPQASLYAVKVLNSRGSGSLSSVVTALDWSASQGIQVANLSLGAVDASCVYFGLCGLGAECTAITNATALGMTVVVAAGNSKDEAAYYTPANCMDSVTVTAYVDSDGLPGGAGPSFVINNELERDDTFAQSFSNFSAFGWDMDGSGAIDSMDDHPIVDLTAPGVAILSTMPTYKVTLNTQYGLPKNYGVLSGTSMATPHVSGAAARFIADYASNHPGEPFSADTVRRDLVLGGECPGGGSPTWLICPTGWPDDPDVVSGAESGSEPLVHAP